MSFLFVFDMAIFGQDSCRAPQNGTTLEGQGRVWAGLESPA